MAPDVMLAVPSDVPPTEFIARAGAAWVFELKFDGIRAVVVRTGSSVRITNRRGVDISFRYPDVVAAAQRWGFDAVLDGEIIVAGPDGRPDFTLAHRRDAQGSAGKAAQLATVMPATFVPFDVLRHGAQDMRAQPYRVRHDVLDDLVDGAKSFSSADGATMWQFVLDQRLEGLVAKRVDSLYHPGRRHPAWVKLKHTKRASVIMTGIEPGKGSRGPVGALRIAVYDNGVLTPVGKVGSGIGVADAAQIIAAGDVPLVVEVEYLAMSPSGQLRMPVFRGIRFDVDAHECAISQF